MKTCSHLAAIDTVRTSDVNQCEECVKTGSNWVHLRTCQSCGSTLCCDSSPNKHASKHALEEGHPVSCSAEPGERWLWCYEDELIARY